MRQLIFSLVTAVLLVLTSGFTNRNSGVELVEGKANVKVIFNHELEFNDVAKIKLDLAEKRIAISYKKLEFDEEGKLLSIDFHVDCKDGFSGGASQRNLTNQSRFGFYRIYSPAAKVSFGTGNF